MSVCVQPSAISLSVPWIPAGYSGSAQVGLPVPSPPPHTLGVTLLGAALA